MQSLEDSKHNLITFLLFIVAIGFVGAAGWLTANPPLAEVDPFDVETFKSREIVDFEVFEEEGGAMVAYRYLGEKLPEKLHPDEIVGMRKPDSYTYVAKRGEELSQYQNVVFSRDVFYEQNGDWYDLEYGEVEEEIFKRYTRTPLQFIHIAYAATTTATFYSGTGDGSIQSNGSTWSATRSGTSLAVDATDESSIIRSAFLKTYFINRGWLPFNTSSIPASATINSATTSVYVSAKQNAENDGNDFISVVQTSQASETSLATSDWSAIGITEGVDSGQRKDITSISTGAYLDFTLNSTGRGWIKKSGESPNCGSTNGYTCLGLREGHDLLNDAPTTANGNGNQITVYYAERTGTSEDPKLEVNYTADADLEFNFGFFFDF